MYISSQNWNFSLVIPVIITRTGISTGNSYFLSLVNSFFNSWSFLRCKQSFHWKICIWQNCNTYSVSQINETGFLLNISSRIEASYIWHIYNPNSFPYQVTPIYFLLFCLVGLKEACMPHFGFLGCLEMVVLWLETTKNW